MSNFGFSTPFSTNSRRRHQRIHRRTLRRRIRRGNKRPRPNHAQLVPRIPIVRPNAVRARVYNLLERIHRGHLLQHLQIPHKHALELCAVCSAVGLAGVVQDAVCVGEVVDRGGGDCLCGGDVGGAVAGCLGELDEGAEDDALVVGPDGAVVGVAGGVEAVADGVVRVDHPRALEPFPLGEGGGEVVRGVAGDAVGEVGGGGEVELVGDGVDVGLALVPPDAAVAGGGGAVGHVVEDVDGFLEVLLLAGYVVDFDPG